MTAVLVVDDEMAILRVVGAGLRARGYEVLTAATGEAALASVAHDNPDVVVLDLGLPDIDGLEVCRRLRVWSAVQTRRRRQTSSPSMSEIGRAHV